MRKNLLGEIKELRKQVLLVQLQSMKVMQQTIHSVFKNQTTKTSDQIAQQNADLQKQLEEETESLIVPPAPGSTNDPSVTDDGQMQAFTTIVMNALKATEVAVDNAMEGTKSVMTEAQNLLKNS